ncbi:MAG TPA: murein biosynthesis integral membrane protein MurJ [Chloroflexi bacterium]|nr:murein biosynthesis integral membrane protein MurJ [Chloroflexota bacterium]
MSEARPEGQKEIRAGQVARSTLIVMGGFALAIVVGLIRQGVVSERFGTSAAYDAYVAANGIPELLFNALAGGALTFAFLPVYTELLERKDEGQADTLFSQVISAIFLLTALASLVVGILAPVLVSAPWGIAPGFPVEFQQLTARLMRVLLVSTLIFAVSNIITGALHAHQHFLLPALTPSVYSGGIIFGAVVLNPLFGIFGLAWGAVIGALLHLLIQVPGLLIHRVRWQPALPWGDPALKRVAELMAPRVIDLLMARISIDWINRNIASRLGEGRVSALSYGYTLMNMPWTLIGTAIGIAVFPTMAALAARKDIAAQRRALSGSLRAILMLALPAAVGLLVLGRPIIRLLFERGEFTARSTELVYFALQFYALTLISQSMLEVVVRAFAAQQDTLTPLIVSFFTTALNIVLAIWLARPFAEGGLEHGGLPLANGIAVGVESLIGLTILGIRWKGLDARRILLDTGKAALSAALMGGAILAFKAAFDPGLLVTLLGGGALGAAIYFGLALLLGIEEVRSIPLMMLRRFGGGEATRA